MVFWGLWVSRARARLCTYIISMCGVCLFVLVMLHIATCLMHMHA